MKVVKEDRSFCFNKPNELVAVIEQMPSNRLAKHFGNCLLKLAQEEIIKNNHTDEWFNIRISEVNSLSQIASKDPKVLDNIMYQIMKPIKIRESEIRTISGESDEIVHRKITYFAPVSNFSLDVDEEGFGTYKFRLDPIIITLLKEFKSYYTQINLQEFNNFESKYAYILFEWLKRYETCKNIPELTLQEFREITATSNKKSYDNFTNLQIKVLDPAISEIEEKTKYAVSYETKKSSGKYRSCISSIKFSFFLKDLEKEIEEKYLSLCKKYVDIKFCDSPKMFYNLTYNFDYNCLQKFYYEKKDNFKNAKKQVIEWLQNDRLNKKRSSRLTDQILYQVKLETKLYNFSAEKYEEFKKKKEEVGFLSYVKLLQKELMQNNIEIDDPILPNKWKDWL